MTEIALPRLNANEDLVKLQRWLVQHNAKVAPGDAIAELESSKVTVELTAAAGGYIEIRVGAGEEHPVGTVVAVLHPNSVDLANRKEATIPDTPKTKPSAVKVSEKAKALAAQHGIDPATLRQSGIVTEKDVQKAITQIIGETIASPIPKGRRRPMTSAERTMARTVSTSLREAAHAFMIRDIDATAVHEWIALQSGRQRKAFAPIDVVIAVVASVLPQKPFLALRSFLDGEDIVEADALDIGITIDVGSRLIVGRIEAESCSDPARIAARRFDLAMRLAKNQIQPNDVARSSLTISAIDDAELGSHFPIIPPGQAAILGITGIRRVPCVSDHDDSVRIGRVISCCLSYDHRFVTGMTANRFLSSIAKSIQKFPTQ